MDYDDDAQLDTSQIEDREGARGGGMGAGGGLGSVLSGLPGGGKTAAGGGLGIIGLIIALFLGFSGGGGGGGTSTGLGPGQIISGDNATSDNSAVSASCRTGADADAQEKCAIVADVNSIQAFWSEALNGYRPAKTVLFSDQTQSGCGPAQTGMGPFYCPVDQQVYLDRQFFNEFRARFGATVGTFAQAYVLAHEYGHHITNLEGNLENNQQDREGPQSGSVRIELQADCYAGVWAKNAVDTGYVEPLSEADIADGLDAAQKVGDDFIQKTVQGSVNPESFTHGSSAQRQNWFKQGLRSGDPATCDTFSVERV